MEENKEIIENEQVENNQPELTLEEKLAQSEDRYVRLYAEFDNYKKRVIKDKEEIRFNAKVSMVTPILDLDNDISIAIKNIKDETTKEGVQLIANKLENFLKSQGIESIQTETYDEDLHEVISVVETGESKILDVIGKGYMLNGKAFRHPKIVLSK
jgi:molecular chaperone GrpE